MRRLASGMFASTSASLIHLCYYWKISFCPLYATIWGIFPVFSSLERGWNQEGNDAFTFLSGPKGFFFGQTDICPVFFTLYLQCFLFFFITDKDFCAELEPLTCSPASRRFSLGGIKDEPLREFDIRSV